VFAQGAVLGDDVHGTQVVPVQVTGLALVILDDPHGHGLTVGLDVGDCVVSPVVHFHIPQVVDGGVQVIEVLDLLVTLAIGAVAEGEDGAVAAVVNSGEVVVGVPAVAAAAALHHVAVVVILVAAAPGPGRRQVGAVLEAVGENVRRRFAQGLGDGMGLVGVLNYFNYFSTISTILGCRLGALCRPLGNAGQGRQHPGHPGACPSPRERTAFHPGAFPGQDFQGHEIPDHPWA